MSRSYLIAAAAVAASCSTVSAAPPAVVPTPADKLEIQPAASWRYHDRCGWRGGRWVVDLGAGKIVVCRPRRPGRDWQWRDEGPRHGWYKKRTKQWHYNNW